ncbi:MAG: hypothetical protein CMI96_01495 [Pelagibacteraceae bacterium]|nr:hypothetical protein [Pelagibacteraceae bacterium]|tara:strand:- start:6795 stop:7466 length:672 start_codon:yes stop_codon:yes gene_type:complete
MEDNSSTNNFFLNIKKTINNNLKLIVIILSVLFLLFLLLQTYNYFIKQSTLKNSISFYKAISIDREDESNKILSVLNNSNDFYAILSQLEIIDKNIKNKNYELVNELYKNLLNDNNLENIYKTAIASVAAYNFINIQLINPSTNYIDDINNYIEIIDDELLNYNGIKLELKFLKIITEVENNNIQYNNYNQAIELYDIIMSNENVSSIIKERVNKIHEYQLYK